MVCLGFEPIASGWQAQMKPQRYCGQLVSSSCHCGQCCKTFNTLLKNDAAQKIDKTKFYSVTLLLTRAVVWHSCQRGRFQLERPVFESNHQQFCDGHLLTVHCIVKTKINKKRPGKAHFYNSYKPSSRVILYVLYL